MRKSTKTAKTKALKLTAKQRERMRANAARHTVLRKRTIQRMAAYLDLQLSYDKRGRYTLSLPVLRYSPIDGTVGKRGGPLYERAELAAPVTAEEIEREAACEIAKKGERQCQKEFDAEMDKIESQLMRLMMQNKSPRINNKTLMQR